MSYPAIEAKGVRFSYGKMKFCMGWILLPKRAAGRGAGTQRRREKYAVPLPVGAVPQLPGQHRHRRPRGKNMQPREIAAKVAYIPQTHTPTFHYTVLEMVLMGTTHRVRGLQSPGAKEVAIAREALAQVGIADMENRSYGRLSGGEQQLVLIARALAQQTELLIMDEPTSSLDYGNQLRVMQRVRALARQGYTILLSSHNPQQALLFRTASWRCTMA